jgi:hypothetical protein
MQSVYVHFNPAVVITQGYITGWVEKHMYTDELIDWKLVQVTPKNVTGYFICHYDNLR